MNVAYNTALRQSKALRHDLDRLDGASAGALTAAEIGNASASLASFGKAIDDYATLARQEIVPKKQEEARERARRFKEDLADMRTRLDTVRRAREDANQAANRSELLGRRGFGVFGEGSRRHGGAAGSQLTFGSGDEMRESHALREQNFFSNTNSALDDYIARGQAVLGDLGQQREMLKNTQKRLYSVANTLGISGDTIKMIERRAREDKWIFAAGAIVFFLFCWLCIHFLR
ncbi:unnamed protein product [Parascedosporium putredinis]|uniref:Protein transport protein BOS1 n=1 Tax=Parascedosporium putredinis TaxID=1442378 RepID=A0A9P1M825_9PEZI|nr:unnamed protein product [Parascedosporium putredinis]CAI7991755.1 unnamed protein product [Parascedosporium putredinis]